MKNIFEKLKEYGADSEGTRNRFLDDEALYIVCFESFLLDESFLKLKLAIDSQNYLEAFDYAHALKGVSGNLGLTPIYEAICSIVDALRKSNYENLKEQYTEIMKQFDGIKGINS